MVGEKPLQITEEPHQDIPKGGEELPPRLEGKRQEQHEEDEGPFEIRDVFHGTLHKALADAGLQASQIDEVLLVSFIMIAHRFFHH